jgi:ATP-dependent DNA ligase
MHYVAWLGLWVKVKCLHREEFVVVGWTDPEGTRPWLGALLLAYYDPDGRLIYAGRAGTGIKQAELERLWRRLQPLATSEMPLFRRLNRWCHIWAYKDAAERFAVRERARNEGVWPPRGGQPGVTLKQENMLVVPASFSPLH